MDDPTRDDSTDSSATVPPPRAADRVLDTGALRALAHPLRVKIYDILSQYGPQTASSLAVQTGESSGATSYHLRALAKHALIEEIADRGTARERWWQRPVGGVSFVNDEALTTPAGRSVTRIVMTEFFRNRQTQLMEFIESGIEDLGGPWREASLVSTASTRLTPDQSAELARKITALIDEAVRDHRDQTGDDVRPVTIRADLFPLPDLGDLA